MSALLNMGGYAQFVWPAYAVTAVGLVGIVAFTLRAYAGARAKLAALEKA